MGWPKRRCHTILSSETLLQAKDLIEESGEKSGTDKNSGNKHPTLGPFAIDSLVTWSCTTQPLPEKLTAQLLSTNWPTNKIRGKLRSKKHISELRKGIANSNYGQRAVIGSLNGKLTSVGPNMTPSGGIISHVIRGPRVHISEFNIIVTLTPLLIMLKLTSVAPFLGCSNLVQEVQEQST